MAVPVRSLGTAFVSFTVLYLAACAAVPPSPHWNDKATLNERMASLKVGGFNRDEARLYHGGVQHLINIHQNVGTFTMRQVVAQERSREAIRNEPKLRRAAEEQVRARELLVSGLLPFALIAGGGLAIFALVRFTRWQEQRRVEYEQRAAEQRKYACFSVRLTNYSEASRLVEQSISTEFRLADEETPVYRDAATLIWDSGTEQVPLGPSVSKTSGGAAGAILGGVLLGPVGAVAGYAASRKTTTAHPAPTYGRTTYGVDPGILIVTNQRVLFIGDRGTTIAEDLTTVLQITAQETTFADRELPSPYAHGRMFGQNEVRFRRTAALPNERFIVRNLAYFMMAINAAGRSDFSPPAKPLPPGSTAA
jgi:hypothetical protein